MPSGVIAMPGVRDEVIGIHRVGVDSTRDAS
jgi:hypothetical protein